MDTALTIVSLILIALVLLQSSKADGGAQIITGGNLNLMANAKERGPEKFITRLTYIMGFLFIFISLLLSFS